MALDVMFYCLLSFDKVVFLLSNFSAVCISDTRVLQTSRAGINPIKQLDYELEISITQRNRERII